MSLRDQLLKAGLVSEKDARKADREKKQQRRQQQGHKKKQRALKAEEEARAKAEREAELARTLEERRRHEEERERVERENRVRQLVHGNRMGARGPYRFHFRDGVRIESLAVSEKMAWKLRCGECAIAVDPDQPGRYHVITARAAEKLEILAPEVVLFHVTDTTGISEPDEAFLEKEWEPSLTPRRARGPGPDDR